MNDKEDTNTDTTSEESTIDTNEGVSSSISEEQQLTEEAARRASSLMADSDKGIQNLTQADLNRVKETIAARLIKANRMEGLDVQSLADKLEISQNKDKDFEIDK